MANNSDQPVEMKQDSNLIKFAKFAYQAVISIPTTKGVRLVSYRGIKQFSCTVTTQKEKGEQRVYSSGEGRAVRSAAT